MDDPTSFQTDQWAQCRNEMPFQVSIRFRHTPEGIQALIDCPHCLRGYSLDNVSGVWSSDRPLKFLSPKGAEAARKTAIQ